MRTEGLAVIPMLNQKSVSNMMLQLNYFCNATTALYRAHHNSATFQLQRTNIVQTLSEKRQYKAFSTVKFI